MARTDTHDDVNYVEELKQACRENDMTTVKRVAGTMQIYHEIERIRTIPGLLEAARNNNMEIVEYLFDKHGCIYEDYRCRLKAVFYLSFYKSASKTFSYFVERFQPTAREIFMQEKIILLHICTTSNFELIRYLCDKMELTKEDFTSVHRRMENIRRYSSHV